MTSAGEKSLFVPMTTHRRTREQTEYYLVGIWSGWSSSAEGGKVRSLPAASGDLFFLVVENRESDASRHMAFPPASATSSLLHVL